MDGKEVNKVIITGATSTMMMTLFSYAASKLKNENYNEAQLLGELIKPLLSTQKQLSQPLGWMGHIGLGLSWAAINDTLFNKLGLKRSISNGVYSGVISGLTGVLIWKALFHTNPNPPRVNRTAFYSQLALAHVVFMLAFVLISRQQSIRPVRAHLPIS